MTYRFLTTLADDLRKGGLKVVEIQGWKTRGRPAHTGGHNPVGVLWHHTGGKADGLPYARWLALTGRPDLPAPLCQLSIGRDGTVYVCAAGRCNHGGVAKSSGTVAAGDANSLYVGVECQNTGSEGWSKSQYDAMVKTGVVLAKLLGTSVQTQRAHRETSVTGKWDPGALNMDKFRADIAAAMRPAPVRKPAKKTKPVPDAAILAATTVTTPSDHKAVGARIKAGPAQFVAVTANIRATPPMRAVNVQRCVDRALGHGVTVAGFNEMGGRNLAALLRKHPGWVALQGKRGDQARAPIAYDSNIWELVRWEVRRLSTKVVKTRLGNIPVPSGNRDATIAVLGHKNTGTEVAFISYHAIAHMNVGSRFGWTGKGPKVLLTLRRKVSNPAIAVFKQGMAVLEETIGELRADGCYVVPMGDWNYDAFADLRDKTPERFGPRATMHRAGVTTIYSAKKLTHGTAGKRGIDYLGVAPPSAS